MVLFRLRLAARRLRINGNFMLRSHHTAKSGECLPNIAKLSERKILKIRGKDSSKFLQGIITNDVNCLVEKHTNVMYAMFLNAQGRVLYDGFLYSIPHKDNEYLLECDADAADGITVHMKRYKLRAKVEVSDANEVEAWAMFSCGEGKFDAHASKSNQNALICQDPRLDRLGMRIIIPVNQSPMDLLGIKDCSPADTSLYKMHRYALGIAEGMQEIPSGNALPLEYNLALTNGVNFQKGCYIGQELTARTHHTGIIRKRLMPIQLKTRTLIPKQTLFHVRSLLLKHQSKQTQGNRLGGFVRCLENMD